MKHLLNDLSEEEKNRIREQHTGGKKIMIENFNKLVNTKLGDARPLTEAETEQEGNCKSAENYRPIQEWVNFSNEMQKRGYVEEIDDHICSGGSQKTPLITLEKNGNNISFIENINNTMWLKPDKELLSNDYDGEYGYSAEGNNFTDKNQLKAKLDLLRKFAK